MKFSSVSIRRSSLHPLATLRAVAAIVLATTAVAACDRRDAAPAKGAYGTPAESLVTLRLTVAAVHGENSASAPSVDHRGVIFSIDDSGNEPILFAVDTTGSDRGRWHLRGAANRDWEAASVAHCAVADPAWCVFVGDVGDNGLERETIVIYRVREPAPATAGSAGELTPDSLVVRYADAPHNVETMYVAPDGSLIVVTKEALRAANGNTRPTLLYRVGDPDWTGTGIREAQLFDSLPIIPRSAPGRTVTDGAIAPDGRYLVIRTYDQLYAFATDSLTGRPLPGIAPAVCDLTALGEAQGEGVGFIGWTTTHGRFAFTSEGNREPLRLANCPLPIR